MMTAFNTYQIALVVVLVLNLIFWILVICFRLFFHFPCGHNDNQQRRRRRVRRPLENRRNSSNRSLVGFTNGTFIGDDGQQEPFTINRTIEAPPSYEDAIKHSTIMISQRMAPQTYLNHQQEGSSQGRRPMVYEQSVVLMVPEESTSVSETRLTTSLDRTSDGIRRSSTTQATVAVDLPAANTRNGDSSIMSECFASSSNSADDNALRDDDGPVTFIVGDLASECVRMTCSTTNVLELADGTGFNMRTQA